jgi:heme exporter protein C
MILFFVIGLYKAIFSSPADYQQGDSVRIMYVHVPASWMCIMIYTIMAFNSFTFVVWRIPLMGIVCKTLAPIGALFTIISLVTGSIWGKPMWGVWWVWDARLTSVLFLLFFYVSYMGIVDSFEDEFYGLRIGSFLCIIGIINLPIIKWSVNWWTTLHQSSSFNGLSSSIHPDMLAPLIYMFLGYILYSWNILNLRLRVRLFRIFNLHKRGL